MIKNKIIFMYCLLAAWSDVQARIIKFPRSFQQELHEMAKCYAQQAGTSVQEMKDKLCAESIRSPYQNYSDILISVEDLASTNYQHAAYHGSKFWSDLYVAFCLLKEYMKVPTEVRLMYCSDHVLTADTCFAQYRCFDRAVWIHTPFFRKCPATRLCTLIHELTHVLQHVRMGMLHFNEGIGGPRGVAKMEREADTRAIQLIQCPYCVQAILAEQLLYEQSENIQTTSNFSSGGYITSRGIARYLRKKSLLGTCAMHASWRELAKPIDCDQQSDLNKIVYEDCLDVFILNRIRGMITAKK